MTKGIKAYKPTTRRLVQLYCALLYNANIKGFVNGQIYAGPTKNMCVPGFNCYSCPGAIGACPLGALQNAVASSGARAGTYVVGILMLYGVLLGRTICGWLCPLGMIQELLNKIPTPKLKKSRVTRVLSYLKYVILAIFAISIPLWYSLKHNNFPLPAFCKYICPAGTFEGAMGLLSNPNNADLFSMLNILFTRKFVIMMVIGLSCVFIYRSFCRFICPLGAIYGLFNRVAIIGVKVEASKCTHCGNCVRHCQMDVRQVGDHECISCGRCMDVCASGAISLRAGKHTLLWPKKEADKAGEAIKERRARNTRIAWALAGVVLLLALCYYNLYLPARESVRKEEASAPAVNDTDALSAEEGKPVTVGYEVGDTLADFSIDTIGGGTFNLAETRGNVMFINLWATYCTPCVQELPYFCALKDAHPEVNILAVHSSLVTEDVEEYLKTKDWDVPFAVDTDDDLVFGIVGGSDVLPQTIVLNAKGEVIYNLAGSVTYEKLEALLKEAEG